MVPQTVTLIGVPPVLKHATLYWNLQIRKGDYPIFNSTPSEKQEGMHPLLKVDHQLALSALDEL